MTAHRKIIDFMESLMCGVFHTPHTSHTTKSSGHTETFIVRRSWTHANASKKFEARFNGLDVGRRGPVQFVWGVLRGGRCEVGRRSDIAAVAGGSSAAATSPWGEA